MRIFTASASLFDKIFLRFPKVLVLLLNIWYVILSVVNTGHCHWYLNVILQELFIYIWSVVMVSSFVYSMAALEQGYPIRYMGTCASLYCLTSFVVWTLRVLLFAQAAVQEVCTSPRNNLSMIPWFNASCVQQNLM